MRNLKKFLALVLAMMMVFGLMVTANATSVDDFVDGDEVSEKYQQAVEVIAALGVLQGDGTSLYPQGKLTRAHMAAVLYRVGTGYTPDTEADDVILQFMKDADTYKDVPAGHWALGYINYVTDRGWLNGYTKDYFGPDDTLTVVQMLSGVLRMLGEEPESTGDWRMDTLKAAVDLGLTSGFTAAELSGDATREMVAQLAFTALNTGGTTTTTYVRRYVIMSANGYNGDNEGTDKLSDLFGVGYRSLDDAMAAAKATDYTPSPVLGTDYTVVDMELPITTVKGSLGDKYFDLSQGTDRDDFGRPIETWYQGDEEISSMLLTPVAEFDKAVTEADIFAEVGAAGIQGKYDKFIVMDEIWVDGKLVNEAVKNSATDFGADKAAYSNSIVIAKNDNSNTQGAGNGTIVEIYETVDDNHYIMVAINQYLGTVGEVIAANANAGTKRMIGIKDVNYNGDTWADASAHTFVTDSFKKNDKVLVTIADGEVMSVEAPGIVSGTVTKKTSPHTSGAMDTYTIGGTAYRISQLAVGVSLDVNSKGNWYLDSCGNIIGVVGSTVTNDNQYLFVVKAEKASYLDTDTKKVVDVLEVTGVTPDGIVTTAIVSNYDGDDDNPVNNPSSVSVAMGLHYYEIDSDGYYELYKDASKSGTGTINQKVTGNASNELKKGDPTIANGVYATNSTKYYTVSNKAKVTTYTGYNDIFNYSDIDDETTGYVLDTDGNVTAVFLYNIGPAAAKQYVYVLSTFSKEGNDTTYDVYVNGVKSTMVINPSTLVNGTPGLYEVSGKNAAVVDASPITLDYAAGSLNYAAADNEYLPAAGAKLGLNYNDGQLQMNNVYSVGSTTYYFASAIGGDVPVYIFEGDKCTTVGIASEDLITVSASKAFITYSSGKISTVYVIK